MTTKARHLEDAQLQSLVEDRGEAAAAAHAAKCAECTLALETYRQLFLDLDRLEDPLPDPAFARDVMARIAAAPAPAAQPLRLALAGLLVTTSAAVVGLLAWIAGGGTVGALANGVTARLTGLAKLGTFASGLFKAVPTGASLAVLFAQLLFLGLLMYGLWRLARPEREPVPVLENAP